MAFHERCSSGGHSHNVSCVDVQLCEGWKAHGHATIIGENILSSVSFGVSGLKQGNVA